MFSIFSSLLRNDDGKKDDSTTTLAHPDYHIFVNLSDFEAYAQKHLPRNARDYYHSGANDMITLRANRNVFADYCLIPRILSRSVQRVDLSTTLLGSKLRFPVAIAPWAMQKMAHPDGENATARAAQRMGTLMTLSSVSTTPLEEVAASAKFAYTHLPPAPLWFQLYVYKDREITAKLIDRAVAAGYSTIVVTVDTPVLGRREADLRNRFALPSHLHLGNFQGPEYANATAAAPNNSNNKTKTGNTSNHTDNYSDSSQTQPAGAESSLAAYFVQQIDASLTWEAIIPFIRRRQPRVKIVLKGILSPEDASTAVSVHAVDGIWVSNHGARQLDTVPATLEVLSAVCEVCRATQTEVYVDGGFTRGTDVVKALALGARAVFLGRPILWGLTHSGEEGVCRVLRLLEEEIALALRLLGVDNVQALNPTHVRRKRDFALLPHERVEETGQYSGNSSSSNSIRARL